MQLPGAENCKTCIIDFRCLYFSILFNNLYSQIIAKKLMCCTKYYESTHPSVLRILDTINHFICLQNTCDYMLLNSQLPFLPCQNSSQPQPILQTSSQDKSFGLVSNFVPCISEVENSHCSIYYVHPQMFAPI